MSDGKYEAAISKRYTFVCARGNFAVAKLLITPYSTTTTLPDA